MQARIAAVICGLGVLVSFGCASSTAKLNHVRAGMSRQEVIALLGEPTHTRAQPRLEYLAYPLTRQSDASGSLYVVRLVDAKVESFGRLLRLSDSPLRAGDGVSNATLNAVLPFPVDLDAEPVASASAR